MSKVSKLRDKDEVRRKTPFADIQTSREESRQTTQKGTSKELSSHLQRTRTSTQRMSKNASAEDLEDDFHFDENLPIVASDSEGSDIELVTPVAAKIDSAVFSDSEDSDDEDSALKKNPKAVSTEQKVQSTKVQPMAGSSARSHVELSSDDDAAFADDLLSDDESPQPAVKKVRVDGRAFAADEDPKKKTASEKKAPKELSKGAKRLLSINYYPDSLGLTTGDAEDDKDNELMSETKAQVDTSVKVSVKNFFEALGEFATQVPLVQTRLLLQLIKFHDLETAGMGKKTPEHTQRVTELPELTVDERQTAIELAKQVVHDTKMRLQDPSTHNIHKLNRIISSALGSNAKQKLACDVNSVIGSPHKLELGSPYIVVVVPSTDRVFQIGDMLTKLSTKKRVCKFFSHGNNLNDQIKELKADIRVAVGTPARLLKLIQLGALKLQRCELFVVDCSRDVKTLNILTMNQVRDDFSELWARYIQMELGQPRGNKHFPAVSRVLFF